MVAKKATFDPEPVSTKYGMLITSPKGAFELRNQEIGEMADDTVGLVLTFAATVWIERAGRLEHLLQGADQAEGPDRDLLVRRAHPGAVDPGQRELSDRLLWDVATRIWQWSWYGGRRGRRTRRAPR